MIGLPGSIGRKLIKQIRANAIHATEGGGVNIDEQGVDGTYLSVAPKGTSCVDPTKVHAIRVTGTVSGTLMSASDCTPPDTSFTISASLVNLDPVDDACVDCGETETTNLDFVCPGDCDTGTQGHITVKMGACLSTGGGAEDPWTLSVSIDYDVGFDFCGIDHIGIGGPDSYLLDLGTDPSGIQTFDFDDPNWSSVHYHVVVTVER